MDLTMLLLKMWGFYMFLMGLSILINKADWKSFVGELSSNKHFTFLAGIFTLTIGMLMVANHNVWAGGFDVVIITVFGWLSLVKGIMYLLFPSSSMAGMAQKFMAGKALAPWAVVVLLLGAYMLLSGFAVI